jgi:hypothetical protein
MLASPDAVLLGRLNCDSTADVIPRIRMDPDAIDIGTKVLIGSGFV